MPLLLGNLFLKDLTLGDSTGPVGDAGTSGDAVLLLSRSMKLVCCDWMLPTSTPPPSPAHPPRRAGDSLFPLLTFESVLGVELGELSTAGDPPTLADEVLPPA